MRIPCGVLADPAELCLCAGELVDGGVAGMEQVGAVRQVGCV
jgi:hypothetical protein